MTWPWSRRTEKRAGSVTDSVIAELQRRAAGGSSGDPSLCAAVQSAAGIWAPLVRGGGRVACQRHRGGRHPGGAAYDRARPGAHRAIRPAVRRHAGRADAAPPCRVRLDRLAGPGDVALPAALHRAEP